MSKESHPLVSILMPAYNAEDTINEAIDSVLQQSYSNFELLIQDDCSSDTTSSLIEAYDDERIKFFRANTNQGYLRTCNDLFGKCVGSFITFQDADDWCDKERLMKQLNFMKKLHVDISGTNVDYYYDQNTFIRSRQYPHRHDDIVQKSKTQNSFCGATIMITDEVLKTVGGYNTLFDRILSEDYDWSLRILKKFRAAIIQEPLYKVRLTENSVSRSNLNPMKFISHELAQYLNTVEDYEKVLITDLKDSRIQSFIHEKLEPFERDVSLVYRMAADKSAYNGHWNSSFLNARNAWFKSPFRIINIKYIVATFVRKLKRRS